MTNAAALMQLDSQSEILIGVDGGGTSSRFALLHEGRRTEVSLGGANVSTDLSGALENLKQGFSKLARNAGLSDTALNSARAYLGLAGVLSKKTAQDVSEEMPFANVSVNDDRAIAVVGALGGADGAVFGIGTGSFLGRRIGERITLHGGWGFTLADEASGADLGRKALQRTVQGIDGTTQKSDLTEGLLRDFGGGGPIVDFAAWAKPSEFAKLAPQVVAAAQAGDENGFAIMTEGAAFIESGIRRLGWEPGQRLCPAGGLAAQYTEYFSIDFARNITPPTGSALDGALMLAATVGNKGTHQ